MRKYEERTDRIKRVEHNRVDKKLGEREQMEESLRAGEERYRALTETAKDFIYIVNPDLTLKYLNGAAARPTRRLPKDLIGKPVVTLFPPGTFEIGLSKIKQVLETGDEAHFDEQLHFAGEVLWANTNLMAIKDSAGKINAVMGITRDISERKRVEGMLAKSEKRFRELAELLPQIIFETDINGNVTFANQCSINSFRYSLEDIQCGINFLALIAPEDREKIKRRLMEILSGAETAAREFQMQRKDGGRFPALIHAAVIIEDGVPIGVRGIGIDITERKQAEEVLRTNEERFRALIEHSYDAITLLKSDGTVLFDTPSIVRVLGYSPSERVGRSVFEFMPPEEREIMSHGFAKFALQTGAIAPSEQRFIHKDGTLRWIEGVRTNLLNEPAVRAVVVNYRDITERKRAEDALRENEEKYRTLVENAAEAIVIVQDDMLKFVNQAASKITGYTRQELCLSPFIEFIHPDDRQMVSERYAKQLEGTESSTPYEFRFINKAGKIKWMNIHATNITWKSKPAALAFLTDISERKLAEDSARESEKRYRELVEFLPIPVYEMDLEANLTAANRAIYETFKGTEEDLKRGLNIWQFISPEGVERSKKNIQLLLRGEKVESTEYTLNRLDGSAFTGMVISSVITRNGRPVGLRGAIIDITERKKAEEDLRQLNAFLDSIVENIPDMIFLKDANELRFVRFNRAGEDLVGFSRDDLLGKSDYDLFPKEQADFFTQRDREVLSGKELINIVEEPLQTRHKGVRILHTKKVPILNGNGESEFLLGISEDITDRKKTEDMLHQTLESLRKAVGVTVRAVAAAVEARDPYTSGHQKRVAALALAIGTEMDLRNDQIEAIGLAASIHDIGKLSIPAEILSKPTRLTEIEYALIKEHSKAGYEILKDVESPWRLAEIIYQHHERMNGSGYPRKLKGDEIILEARIISVADVVEAMSTHRPYRPALGSDAALKEIENNRGILYDFKVVDACLKLFREKGYQLPNAD